jgi:hypothetical protein
VSQLGKGLRAYLMSKTAVNNLVSGRIYPVVLPQNPTLPAIVYSLVNANRPESMIGGTGLVQARVQVDCWALTQDAAASLSNEVRKVLQGFSGNFGSGSTLVVVQAVHVVGEYEMHEPDVNNYRVIIDYHIWYEEDLPTV